MPPSRRRTTARGGSPPRCVAWHPAPRCRAPPSCGLASRAPSRTTLVRLGGRARCSHRAAAPLPVAARHRGARLGIPHTLRVLHAAALSAAWCAAGPRTRRDVMIAPPFTRALYPGGAMGTSRPTAITHAWVTRALPTHGAPRHHTRNIRMRITPPVRPRPCPPPCGLASRALAVRPRRALAARPRRAPSCPAGPPGHRPWGLPTRPAKGFFRSTAVLC